MMKWWVQTFGSNFQSDPICFLQVAATSALTGRRGKNLVGVWELPLDLLTAQCSCLSPNIFLLLIGNIAGLTWLTFCKCDMVDLEEIHLGDALTRYKESLGKNYPIFQWSMQKTRTAEEMDDRLCQMIIGAVHVALSCDVLAVDIKCASFAVHPFHSV